MWLVAMMSWACGYTVRAENFHVNVCGPNWKWSASTRNISQKGILVGGVTCRDDECRVLMWDFAGNVHPGKRNFKVFLAICSTERTVAQIRTEEFWVSDACQGAQNWFCCNSVLLWAVYVTEVSLIAREYWARILNVKVHGTLDGHFRRNVYLNNWNSDHKWEWPPSIPWNLTFKIRVQHTRAISLTPQWRKSFKKHWVRAKYILGPLTRV